MKKGVYSISFLSKMGTKFFLSKRLFSHGREINHFGIYSTGNKPFWLFLLAKSTTLVVFARKINQIGLFPMEILPFPMQKWPDRLISLSYTHYSRQAWSLIPSPLQYYSHLVMGWALMLRCSKVLKLWLICRYPRSKVKTKIFLDYNKQDSGWEKQSA